MSDPIIQRVLVQLQPERVRRAVMEVIDDAR
jgi:hypothetical protein